jgi:DNA-binding Xre family transcriptional regulator
MIRYNFDRVFKARGISRPFTFLKNAGFSDNFATKIKNSKVKRIDLTEIEKLCILLQCTPNDFFEWEPDDETQVGNDHPIQMIRKSDKVIDISKTLNSIPLGQLGEIEQMINEKIQSNKK